MANSQPYQQLMVLFSSYVVALREQDFSEEVQQRILSKTGAALTQIYTAEVLSKPRKRQGFYRAASTPSTSKKIPADQRVQFSAKEIKKLNLLNGQINSKLYSQGITTEQWLNSLTSNQNTMLYNLKAGLIKLKLMFNSEDIDLLIRKYNALMDNSGRINFSEFSHLFPKSKVDRPGEDVKTHSMPKDGSEQQRGIFTQITFHPLSSSTSSETESNSSTSKSSSSFRESSDMSDEEEREDRVEENDES